MESSFSQPILNLFKNPVDSTFKYILNPSISHNTPCYFCSSSHYHVHLDYYNSFLICLCFSALYPILSLATRAVLKIDQIMSLFSKPHNSLHFTTSKSRSTFSGSQDHFIQSNLPPDITQPEKKGNKAPTPGEYRLG